MSGEPATEATFDLDLYLSLPRVAGLALSPDGWRLVTSVALPGPDRKKVTRALGELDPAARAAPRRLTRSALGEANAAFLPDGSLLFTSARDDPEATGDAKPEGEVARPRRPAALEAAERRDKARSDAGVSALLFESYPIRYWDHYLGPRAPRLFAAAPPTGDQRMAPGRPLTPAPGPGLREGRLGGHP